MPTDIQPAETGRHRRSRRYRYLLGVELLPAFISSSGPHASQSDCCIPMSLQTTKDAPYVFQPCRCMWTTHTIARRALEQLVRDPCGAPLSRSAPSVERWCG